MRDSQENAHPKAPLARTLQPKERAKWWAKWRVAAAMTMLGLTAVFYQNCGSFEVSTNFSEQIGLPADQFGRGGETFKKVSPANLFAPGGKLTIEGTGFSSSTTVEIGDVPCEDLKIISSTLLECRAPSSLSGYRSLVLAGLKLENAIQYVEPSKVETLAGAAQGLQHLREAVLVGRKLYLADASDAFNAIRVFDMETRQLTTVAGGDNPDAKHEDGVGPSAKLNLPLGLAAKDGALYIAEYGSCLISKMDLATNSVTKLIGVDGTCAITDGTGAAARLGNVEKLVLVGNEIYFTDHDANDEVYIRKLDLGTLTVTTLLGGGASATRRISSYWGPRADALITQVPLASVKETTHDYDSGTVYNFEVFQMGAKAIRLHFSKLKTQSADRIKIYDADDTSMTAQPLLELSGDFGEDFWSPPVKASRLRVNFEPMSGQADYGFAIDRIAYTDSNETLATIGHSQDLPAAKSRLQGDITDMVYVNGALYFSEDGLKMVRKLDLATMKVSGVAGNLVSGDRGVGALDKTGISLVGGLATDGSQLYLSDFIYDRLLHLDLTAKKSTSILSTRSGSGPDVDGPLASATLASPSRLFYDGGYGLCFLGDQSLRCIR